MKITIWPISLDRKCARRPEKINGVLDKQHRKSLPSETVSQSRKMQNYHSEQSEESNVSCHLLKRDPSAIASG
jgi:hypothetical protein